ncbi:MAG: BRO-N domain-containing protein, partial [Paludibacter sp.]
MNENKMQLFEDKRIRTAWNEEEQEWYFAIVDVVAVLTDSPNPQTYWRVMKKRMKDEGNETVTNCNALKMTAADGKKRLTDVANTEQLLRIIQSVPSPKAEPFKLWLAKVGSERIDETIDPELAIDRALDTYLKKGYSPEWIHQRLLSIRVRNDLTAEWDARGVQKGLEYAILTDEITKAWSGFTTRQYRNYKGLKKENLRDNMSDLELILNMLAESTTTEISRQEEPENFEQNKKIAKRG